MIMIQVNVHEMKAKLSVYLAAALRGERVVIARRNVPVAELKPIAAPPRIPRPLGQGPREEGYELPDTFWEPLPEELIAAFKGIVDTPDNPPAR
jgi:antitoxin (DNA-binding transcriptional repressor) of toxin-antitoxin stability system